MKNRNTPLIQHSIVFLIDSHARKQCIRVLADSSNSDHLLADALIMARSLELAKFVFLALSTLPKAISAEAARAGKQGHHRRNNDAIIDLSLFGASFGTGSLSSGVSFSSRITDLCAATLFLVLVCGRLNNGWDDRNNSWSSCLFVLFVPVVSVVLEWSDA